MGDQRRRHLAGVRQPRHQLAPGLPAGRRDGLEHRQPVQRPASPHRRTTSQGGFFWCGDDPARAAAGPASGGAARSTSSGPASTASTAPSATARPSARWPRRARRAGRPRTSRPTPTRTRGYAEYCTGNARTPRSVVQLQQRGARPRLVRDRRHQPVHPAVGRDHRRPGQLHRAPDRQHQPAAVPAVQPRAGFYFHDITGVGAAQQAATNNGLFPTTPGYDLATGIGTPEMAALITGARL